MTPDQLSRFSRHLLIPEVGVVGQEKLLKSKVLVVGAGGLGCPVALYLAGAGVGTVGIVDDDRISLSNLHRQILYDSPDVGLLKTDIAATKLKANNPDINIHTYPVNLTSSNIKEIFLNYEYIIDGTDNFTTRYLVNDACIFLGKKNIFGCIYRWEGQSTIFGVPGGPCYRCLFPTPPPPDQFPSCAEAGVFGVLPGIIGLIQAAETIKLILEVGDSLVGRLLIFNALAMTWKDIKISKNPNCPLCGENQTIFKLEEYQHSCSASQPSSTNHGKIYRSLEEITPEELTKIVSNNKDEFLLLDVRDPIEFEIARIEGAKLIPLSELTHRISEIKAYQYKTVIAYCHLGYRSLTAAQLLRDQGFTNLFSLKGGIDEWSKSGGTVLSGD